jgi:hypothetical protein
MAKPKITHKMVRRISFMSVSFQSEKSGGQKAAGILWAQDRYLQHTRGGNAQFAQ